MLKFILISSLMCVTCLGDVTVGTVTVKGNFSGECKAFMSSYLLLRSEMFNYMNTKKMTRLRYIVIYVKKYRAIYIKTLKAKKSVDTEANYKKASDEIDINIQQAKVL